MSACDVSVVMPVRDAAATLEEAVDSIRAQTFRAWELVAIDDGSTDGSRSRLEGHARRDARIRVVPAAGAGVVAALNTGLRLSRGALIARMDADDVALPERLEQQRAHLARQAGVGLVATRVIYDGDRARRAGYARYVDWTNGLLSETEMRLASFIESPFAHPSVMFRRTLVERFGGYADGDFPEDYELWLRWLAAGVRMEKLPEPLLRWRDGVDRLSRRDPRYTADAFDRVRAPYLGGWLRLHNAHHPDVIVWGAGRVSRRRARRLAEHGVAIRGWIDVDPRKIGRIQNGAPVMAASELPAPGGCFVVACVGSHGARELIDARLRGAGYRAGVHYLLAA